MRNLLPLLALAALIGAVVFFGNGAFTPDADKPITVIEMIGPQGRPMQLWCMRDGNVVLYDGRGAAPMSEASCIQP